MTLLKSMLFVLILVFSISCSRFATESLVAKSTEVALSSKTKNSNYYDLKCKSYETKKCRQDNSNSKTEICACEKY